MGRCSVSVRRSEFLHTAPGRAPVAYEDLRGHPCRPDNVHGGIRRARVGDFCVCVAQQSAREPRTPFPRYKRQRVLSSQRADVLDIGSLQPRPPHSIMCLTAYLFIYVSMRQLTYALRILSCKLTHTHVVDASRVEGIVYIYIQYRI